jgi:tetratricopeptide (TPR) repeat protein
MLYSRRVEIVKDPVQTEERSFPSGYTAKQAAKLLGLSEAQIRSYVQEGFLHPRHGPRGELRLSFRDLVLLRTAKGLIAEFTPQRVKRALRGLKDRLPRGRELSAVRIIAEGDEVVVHDGRAAWNPESGQTLINFEVSELAAEVAPLAVEAVEDAKVNDTDMVAEDWYELGCDLETHEPDHAREAYRRALELDPLHPDAHVNLGRLLHETGQIRAAEAHYRLALRARPRDATAAFNLGVSLQDAGRRLDAIRAYRRALQMDPSNADAHYNLGQLYEESGHKQNAIRHLQIYARLVGD